MIHKSDWVGTTLMDPAEGCFDDLLVEQLQRHVDKLPHFEGIAIDRLDYSEYFNYGEHFGILKYTRPSTLSCLACIFPVSQHLLQRASGV